MNVCVGQDLLTESLSCVFQTLEVPLLLLSMGGQVQLANPAAYELLATDEQSLVGTDFVSLLRESTQAELISQQLMRTGHFRDFHAVLGGAGEPILVSLSARILFRKLAHYPLGILVVLNDLRPAAALQHNILQTTKMTVMGQMSAGIAHEVNNPLSGAMGLTELVLESPEITVALREDVAEIYAQLERCRTVVKRLLTLGRGPTGLEWQTIDLDVLLVETLALTRNELQLNGVECRYRGGQECVICTDRHHLQQVFLNLILNACKAMPEGGSLTIDTFREADRVHVHFTDTGRGIAEEHKSRIFEPFFTTAEAGEGMGIGLSLSQLVVRSLGGQIRLKSEVGRGSTFMVTIPMVVPALAGLTWYHLEALQDRRAHVRGKIQVPFTLRCPLSQRSWSLSSLDFGAGGLRATLAEPLDPSVDYELSLKLGQVVLPCQARLAWQGGGQGAFRFSELSAAARLILDELVADRLQEGVTSGRRRAARLPGLRYVELLEPGGARTLGYGYLTDISPYGARLQTDKQLATGTRLVVSLMPHDEAPSCEVCGSVRWSSPLRQERSDSAEAPCCFVHGVSVDDPKKLFPDAEEPPATEPELLEFLLQFQQQNTAKSLQTR